jgi:hypothetical protein
MANQIPIPDEKINFVQIKEGETFKLGPMTCRIMEDGSRTGLITNLLFTLVLILIILCR